MSRSGGAVKPRRHSFRIFPTEAKSERGAFAQYIEESGANFLLITAIADLFDLPNKPENPIEWLRLYFSQLAPKRTTEINEDQTALKKEIMKQESMLIHLRMKQHRLEGRLEELHYEEKHIHTIPPKPCYDEEFKRYKDISDDPRWRIRPDPDIVLTKGDIMKQALEADVKSTILNILPAETDREDYKDYPKMYFGIEQETETMTPIPTLEQLQSEAALDEGQAVQNSSKEAALLEAPQVQEKALSVLNLTQVDKKLPELNIKVEAEAGGEDKMEDETGEQTEEEEEQFGALKSGRIGKRSDESSKSAVPTPSSHGHKREKEKKKVKKESKSATPPTPPPSSPAPVTTTKEPGDSIKQAATDELPVAPSNNIPVGLSSSGSELKAGSKQGNTKKDKKAKRNKSKVSTQDEEIPEPVDPLTLELEQVTQSFWKEDFSLIKGHEKMFDFDDAEEFGYEDTSTVLLEDETVSGFYLSSRGERRQRLLGSQIIPEALFKPDRGRSVQFDSQFDLPDFPLLVSNTASSAQQLLDSVGATENSEARTMGSAPSLVTATISDGTILSRLSASEHVKYKSKSKRKRLS